MREHSTSSPLQLVRLPSSHTASSLKPSLAICKKSNGNVILRLSTWGWKWAQDEKRTRPKCVPPSSCRPGATGRSEPVSTPQTAASGLRHRPTPWRRWEENDASSSQGPGPLQRSLHFYDTHRAWLCVPGIGVSAKGSHLDFWSRQVGPPGLSDWGPPLAEVGAALVSAPFLIFLPIRWSGSYVATSLPLGRIRTVSLFIRRSFGP